MGGAMLPLMMGPMMMGPMMGMGLGMGMGGACDDILGPQGRGALGGGLLGGLAGGLLGGPGGAIGGMLGGGILGAILGKKRHQNCRHNHCQQFPPPFGGGFGGPGCGGYGGGFPGMGFPGGGGFGGGGFGGDPYSQGYQAGQYQAGYQAGLQAGGGGGFGGNPWGGGGFGGGGFPGSGYGGGGGGGYFGDNYGIQPGGCRPPGHGWNGGCCPPQHCRNPHSTGNPGGQLEQNGGDGKPIGYTTSGGWNVRVDKDKVIITDPTGKQKIEHSGDPHEYVNGKHIKDWEGKDRSIVLPDGTKITMGATGPQGLVTSTSIYDGDQNVQINNETNQITHHSFNPYDTKMREAWQNDGETSAVRTSWDGNKLSYDNLYTQDDNFNVRSNYKHLAGDQGPWYSRPFFGLFGGPRTRDAYNDPRYLFT